MLLYPTGPLQRVEYMYNCSGAPAFAVRRNHSLTKRDLERIPSTRPNFREAKKKFTVRRGREVHDAAKGGSAFARSVSFFDTEERHCTIYGARPSTCRSYPGGPLRLL